MLVFEVASVIVRWQEFLSLNVRWDSNAYGSAAWTLVGLHSTLLLADLIETATLTVILYSSRRLDRHYSDATDVTFYWYFMVAAWIPLYVLSFLAPHWL